MSRLLPFKSEPTQSPEGARVLSLEDEATEEALSALSSDTAREVLSLVYEEPRTPPEVRDEIGTSLQNVHYHLDNLEEADLIQPAGSGYSEKGTEMTVYAPASEAVVLFAGAQDDGSRLQTALARLLGAVGLLALASVAVKRIARNTIGVGGLGSSADSAAEGGSDGGGGDGASGAGPEAQSTGGDAAATSTPTENVSAGDSGGGDGGGDVGIFVEETPTPTGEGTPMPTPGSTPTPAATSTPAATPTAPPAGTPTATPFGTPAPSPTAAATETATPTPAATSTPAATPTPQGTPTPQDTPVSTPDRAIEGTPSPTETASPVPTEAPVSPTEGAESLVAAGDGGLLADPAVAFFLGGLFMLAVAGAWWYVSG
jgi:DNA-binding transcriptional ArsR family regulator